ncbi:MAG: helix-turn-helix domain-containing protein [Candidatus Aminicenantes bacterium]|nr:helix-turn-helix domain-containing protein [Candidatus Aminicenantes bacterium]
MKTSGNNSMPLLATIEDLSELLQVSESTIHRLIKAGLPCIKVGRLLRFKVDRVEKYLDRMSSDRIRLVRRRP